MSPAMFLPILLSCALAACQRDTPAPDAAQAAPRADSAEARIETDVRLLADDVMEGRETGTPGHDRAADYVATRMRVIGLEPAGDNGSYFQAVPLLKATRAADGARLAITHPDRTVELRFRDQFLTGLDFDQADVQVSAPAVFVGYGVHAPELRHDDFAGLDVRGKIALLFNGAPARFDNDRRAHYSSTREKLAELAARGAVGAITINTGADEARTPWSRTKDNWQQSGMRLRGADGKALGTFPQLKVTAVVSAAAADLLLEGSGRFAAELARDAQTDALRGFALPTTLHLAARSRIAQIQSRNVVGKLAGSDAALANDHLVHTAHLDHVGIGAPVNDDRIYNGALDNALGVSIMLETARMLTATQPHTKRGMLFVALTGEEKGLLGAEWFAQHPPVPRDALVANINMDMPILLAPSTDVVAIGAEHSSLQQAVEAAAKDVGVALSADPFPEEVVFVRSDQYAFIRAGIPAILLSEGVTSADGKRDPKLASMKFLREHYHQPSDQADLPIAYGDAARMARLSAAIARIVGNAAQRPHWNKDDFFGRTFAPAP